MSPAAPPNLGPPKVFEIVPEEGDPEISRRIPKFYVKDEFLAPSALGEEEKEAIEELFAQLPGGVLKEGSDLRSLDWLPKFLGLSCYLASPLVALMQREKGEEGPISKEDMARFWPRRLKLYDRDSNFFLIASEAGASSISQRSLRELVVAVVEAHPGLQFLASAPEFQERYAETVVTRCFYHHDFRQLQQISLADLKREPLNIACVWLELDEKEDINQVRLFTYEHFYVIYCKFFELDQDKDFLLDKEDLLKYDGHAFSRRAIDRIFSEVGRKFTSEIPGKMGFEDFTYFLLSDEDKTSEQSLLFFFTLVDLDGDGVITISEMQYFYIEQVQRLECLNQESVALYDLVCQMNDMIEPEEEGRFTLKDFRKNKKFASTFFSILLSLNKFLQYEQRDPFALKADEMEHPDWTDWDRFASSEYLRLAAEDSPEDECRTVTSEAHALAMEPDLFLREEGEGEGEE